MTPYCRRIATVLAGLMLSLSAIERVAAQNEEPGKVAAPANSKQDPQPNSPPEKTDAKAEAKTDKKPDEKNEAKPVEPSLLDKLSKELFKEIDDGDAVEQKKENKLESAARGMRTAGEKLDERATGKETRKIQEQVIRDLDELIKQMQNPPPSQSGGGGGGGGGGSSGGGGGSSAAGGGSSGKTGSSRLDPSGGGQGQLEQGDAGQGADQNASGGQDKKVADGSEERSESERKAAAEAARKKKLEMDVWGHLPPHLREQLLNTYGERMLPSYELLVKQFYEALSEQGETPRRR
jgi:hypothetical protein